MSHYHFDLAMETATAKWNRFVAELRSDIMLHAPIMQHESKEPAENWFEFVKRMRFEIEHPDKELLAEIAKKDAKIMALEAQVATLQQQLEQQQADDALTLKPTSIMDESFIYELQLQQTQQFINDNSKADVSRIRELLRKIMPAEYHAEIDHIKEAKAFNHFDIHGGINQIMPNAKVGIQK